MPSDKKRINLTVPDNIYEQILQYKDENGLANDATACLQLIVRQLKAHEQGKTMLSLIQQMGSTQFLDLCKDGYDLMKQLPQPAASTEETD